MEWDAMGQRPSLAPEAASTCFECFIFSSPSKLLLEERVPRPYHIVPSLDGAGTWPYQAVM